MLCLFCSAATASKGSSNLVVGFCCTNSCRFCLSPAPVHELVSEAEKHGHLTSSMQCVVCYSYVIAELISNEVKEQCWTWVSALVQYQVKRSLLSHWSLGVNGPNLYICCSCLLQQLCAQMLLCLRSDTWFVPRWDTQTTDQTAYLVCQYSESDNVLLTSCTTACHAKYAQAILAWIDSSICRSIRTWHTMRS